MMDILFNLIIGPLKVLFELVFTAAYRIFQNPFLVLVSMSIVVNLFALPLYKRADAIQEEENFMAYENNDYPEGFMNS